MAENRIKGIVKDKDGPRAKALITASLKEPVFSQTVSTNPAGAFDLRHLVLDDVEYTVTIETDGKRRKSKTVKIKAGGETKDLGEIDLTPGAAGRIHELGLKGADEGYARNAEVNLDEARYFHDLYMVGNYVLAGVVEAIENLQDSETRVPMDALQWEAWWNDNGDKVFNLQNQIREEPMTVDRLMAQVRSAFDLGDGIAEVVNTEFKTLFREFVGLCASDAFAVNLVVAQGQASWEESKTQEVLGSYRRVKRTLIRLVEMMSRVGRPDMLNDIIEWSEVVDKALPMLKDAARNASGDTDDKHIWGFVARLNGVSKSSIDPHIEHAPKGSRLLRDVIQVYRRIGGNKQDYSAEHLKNIFYGNLADTDVQMPDPANRGNKIPVKVGALMNENASVLQEFWPVNWR